MTIAGEGSYSLIIVKTIAIPKEVISAIYTMHLSAKHFKSSIIITQWGRFYYPWFIEGENEHKEKL